MDREEETLIDVDEIEEVPEEFLNSGTETKDDESHTKEVRNNKNNEEKSKKSNKKKEKIPPTDDIIADNLVEAFALLSSMLDEAKTTKENIEKIHESILKLLEVVTSLREASEEFSKINQIVKEINVLVKAISINNSNIKELIDVIYKIVEKQDNLEQDLTSVKNELFFTDEKKKKEIVKKINSSNNNRSWLQILNFSISLGTLVILFFILLKLKGAI